MVIYHQNISLVYTIVPTVHSILGHMYGSRTVDTDIRFNPGPSPSLSPNTM